MLDVRLVTRDITDLLMRTQGARVKPQRCDESVLKPSKVSQQGPSIPDFLKVPLSEAEQKGILHRDMLRGTPCYCFET